MVKKEEKIEKRERIVAPSSQREVGIEKVLVENFVSLQRIMTNLAVKFENLSNQISKLLELFEISAKTLAEKGVDEKEKKIVEKLDSLLEQNKVIAKGLALLHERNTPEQYTIPSQPVQRVQYMQPMQRFPSNLPKNPRLKR